MERTHHVDCNTTLDDAELDAHRQVLGMAAAIEQLSQDFARQQEELAAAYKRLQQYAVQQGSSDSQQPSTFASSDTRGDASCCLHETELEEMQRLLEVKDLALAEALQQRNEHRLELEKAETLIRELRALHLDTTGGRVPHAAWKVYPPSAPGPFSTGASKNLQQRPSSACATQYSTANAGTRTPLSSAATAALLGCPGAINAPRGERFDVESAYQQRKETNDLFWRKQYKQAVQMRKTPLSLGQQQHAVATQQSSGQPSLRIFSCPSNRRNVSDQRRDESVPFSRYIGISSRQTEIIKEQHRLLS
ncbi:hypothetical protein BBJ28_00005452 [Nothophytophthora sp. Chile5]|nr:hypothetical protein BBJ28_00005452 [Nothophytophthora sp. Chile5]